MLKNWTLHMDSPSGSPSPSLSCCQEGYWMSSYTAASGTSENYSPPPPSFFVEFCPSGFWCWHGPQTALVVLVNNLCLEINKANCTLLIMLILLIVPYRFFPMWPLILFIIRCWCCNEETRELFARLLLLSEPAYYLVPECSDCSLLPWAFPLVSQ